MRHSLGVKNVSASVITFSEDCRPAWPYIHVNNQQEETRDGIKSIKRAVYLWGWIRLSGATQNLSFSLDHACTLSRFSRVQPLPPCGQQTTRLLCPWNSPGKSTGVGCHFFLQGIFPTQGSSPRLLCLLHWQAGSLDQGLVNRGSQAQSGPLATPL